MRQRRRLKSAGMEIASAPIRVYPSSRKKLRQTSKKRKTTIAGLVAEMLSGIQT